MVKILMPEMPKLLGPAGVLVELDPQKVGFLYFKLQRSTYQGFPGNTLNSENSGTSYFAQFVHGGRLVASGSTAVVSIQQNF